MSWRREEHYARALRAPQGITCAVIDIAPRHAPTHERAPVPEQDVRELARRQRHNAGVYSAAEVAALAYANEAIAPRESVVDRASRWLRELMERSAR